MEVYETQHPLLKKFIVNIYFKDESDDKLSYRVFPATITPTSLFRNAHVDIGDDEVFIRRSEAKSVGGIIYTMLLKPFSVNFESTPDSIAINFRPGCVSAFIPNAYTNNTNTHFFNDWNSHLDQLLKDVFSITGKERLKIVEDFLLVRFLGTAHYEPVYQAAQILSDFSNEYTINEVAAMVGVPYKMLYRNFVKYISCSPAHFRRVGRFRTSVYDKILKGDASTLTDISYGNNYTDQSYFIKEFRKYTGENPRDFFRHITVLGNNKIVWKFT